MPRRPHPAPPAPAAGLRAVTVTGLLALLLVVLGAAPASAHARFTGSDPAEGSQLGTLPATVVMSYSEEIAPQFVETAVVTPDGTTVPTTATAAGPDVSVDLAGAGLAADGGTWQVVARVVSVDGHPVEHTTTFTVAEPSSPAPLPADPTEGPATGDEATDPATDPASDAATDAATDPATDPAGPVTEPATDPVSAVDGLPGWAVAAGAAVLVLAAAAALVVQLRRRPPTG